MTERDRDSAFEGVVEDALHRVGDRVLVGAPPTAEMMRQHRHSQRRRALVTSVAASVAVAVSVGGLWFATQELGGSGDEHVAGLPQAKGQWVGMRHVAVDVGTDWTEGQACDQAASPDTYDVTGFRYVDPHCEGTNPNRQEQRTKVSFTPFDEDADPARMAQAPGRSDAPVHEIEVDGHRVFRSEVRCSEVEVRVPVADQLPPTATRCMAGLAVPDEGVSLGVWSFEGKAAVDELLASLRIVDDHVAVPGPLGSFDEYRTEVERLGLEVDAVTPTGRPFAGDVAAQVTQVVPEQGTFVPVDSTVEVRVRPAGEQTHLVGLGHVTVDVPPQWDYEAIQCGVPEQDTYSFESRGSATFACAGFWAPDLTWVELSDTSVPTTQPDGWSEEQVDGATAWVQPVRCESVPTSDLGEASTVEHCMGSVVFPDEGAQVSVRSTAGESAVHRRLDTVRVLAGEVGVPASHGFFNDHQERSGEKYVEHLESLGLKASITYRADGEDSEPGFVLETFPAAGEMLDVGSTVDVVISSGSG